MNSVEHAGRSLKSGKLPRVARRAWLRPPTRADAARFLVERPWPREVKEEAPAGSLLIARAPSGTEVPAGTRARFSAYAKRV